MVEWGKTGEPAYITYGDKYGPAAIGGEVLGGFELEGDISSLMMTYGI